MGAKRDMRIRSGFTLLELVVAIAVAAIVVPLAYEGYLGLKQRSFEAQTRSQALAGLASLNAQVSLIVRNAYAVDYGGTKTASDGSDEISLYADKQERVLIRAYVERDAAAGTARVMVRYGDSPPRPLHSNLLFVEKLDFAVSPDPRSNPARADDQPWASVSVSARARSPLARENEDPLSGAYLRSGGALTGRWVLRNFVPSSLKH